VDARGRRSGKRGQTRTRFQADVVPDGIIRGFGDAMTGYVLLERTAESDVDQLYAAADAQDRYVAPENEVEKRQLRLIAARIDAAAARLAGTAGVNGGEVAAAAEDHRVHADDQRIERVQRGIVHHGHHLGADHLDGIEVILGKILAAIGAAVRQQADARDAIG